MTSVFKNSIGGCDGLFPLSGWTSGCGSCTCVFPTIFMIYSLKHHQHHHVVSIIIPQTS